MASEYIGLDKMGNYITCVTFINYTVAQTGIFQEHNINTMTADSLFLASLLYKTAKAFFNMQNHQTSPFPGELKAFSKVILFM